MTRCADACWHSAIPTAASGWALLFFIVFSQVENAECRRSMCRHSRDQTAALSLRVQKKCKLLRRLDTSSSAADATQKLNFPALRYKAAVTKITRNARVVARLGTVQPSYFRMRSIAAAFIGATKAEASSPLSAPTSRSICASISLSFPETPHSSRFISRVPANRTRYPRRPGHGRGRLGDQPSGSRGDRSHNALAEAINGLCEA